MNANILYEKICQALLEKSKEIDTEDFLDNIDDLIEEIENIDEIEGLSEVAPPGEEDLVLALKKHKNIKNPWALAWSIHNKKLKNKKAQ